MSKDLKKTALWIGMLVLVAGAAVPMHGLATENEATRKVAKKVLPVYPSLARQWHLAGTVKITLVVAPDGKVTSFRTVGGHPVLIPAAEEAAKQWRFEASPRETSETVAFDFTEPNK